MRHLRRTAFELLLPLAAVALFAAEPPINIPAEEAQAIGRKVWRNESGGTINGLTAWNKGEAFASLGIGHFIWYPEGERGPFEESFPGLVVFLRERRADVPEWLATTPHCPWKTREEFTDEFDSDRLRSLRKCLADTVSLQAAFLALRLQKALPTILESLPQGSRERVRRTFMRVAKSRGGFYPLIDYVNFKGEGTSPTERYEGQGWGLLQALDAMETTPEGPEAIAEFAKSADRMLTRRVRNAPAERHEERWLPGWRKRVQTYTQP